MHDPQPATQPVAGTTRRSQAEDLAAIRQRLKLALAATQLGIWELDRRSGMRLGSSRMAEIAGLTIADMAAPGFDWFDLVHPEDRQAVLAVYFDNRGDDRLVQHQYRIRHAQGHEVWIDACLQVLARDARGEAQHMVGTVADITPRKRAEQQRDRQRQLLDLLNQAQAEFLLSHDLPQACRLLLAPLLPLAGARSGLVALIQDEPDNTQTAAPPAGLDDGAPLLHPIALASQADDAAAAPAPLAPLPAGLAQLLLQATRRPGLHITRGHAMDAAAARLPDGWPPLAGLVALPLQFGAQPVGVLALGWAAADAMAPQAELAELLSPLASGLGALVHAQALDGARRRAEALLLHQASTDALTGLANRGHFMATAQAALALARRSARPLTLVVIDLDHFKRINDNHGHAAGDEVLRRFAALARPLVRSADLVGRLGGEEFGVLLRDTAPAHAFEVLQRLREALATTPILVGGHALRVTLSAGLVGWPDAGGQDVDSLLALADQALYAAKRAGRNTVRCHPADPAPA